MKQTDFEWETTVTCDNRQGRVLLKHYPTGLFVFRDFDNYLGHRTIKEMEEELKEKITKHET